MNLVTGICLLLLPIVDLQMPVAVYQYHVGPPIYALPPPPPVAIPVPVPIAVQVETTTATTTTTTSTTEKTGGFFVAVPAPYPVPVPVYPQVAVQPPNICYKVDRPKSCPSCPPCPPPPPPMPAPAPVYPLVPLVPVVRNPVVVVPYPTFKPRYRPPRRPRRPRFDFQTTSSSSQRSSSESWENSWNRKRRRRKIGHIKRFKSRRRNVKDDNLIRPVLNYVANNGKVKLHRRLTKNEAEQLMKESETSEEVKNLSEDSDKVGDISNYRPKKQSLKQRKQQRQRAGLSHYIPEPGSKRFVFEPLHDRKITNLSVSFKVV